MANRVAMTAHRTAIAPFHLGSERSAEKSSANGASSRLKECMLARRRRHLIRCGRVGGARRRLRRLLDLRFILVPAAAPRRCIAAEHDRFVALTAAPAAAAGACHHVYDVAAVSAHTRAQHSVNATRGIRTRRHEDGSARVQGARRGDRLGLLRRARPLPPDGLHAVGRHVAAGGLLVCPLADAGLGVLLVAAFGEVQEHLEALPHNPHPRKRLQVDDGSKVRR